MKGLTIHFAEVEQIAIAVGRVDGIEAGIGLCRLGGGGVDGVAFGIVEEVVGILAREPVAQRAVGILGEDTDGVL